MNLCAAGEAERLLLPTDSPAAIPSSESPVEWPQRMADSPSAEGKGLPRALRLNPNPTALNFNGAFYQGKSQPGAFNALTLEPVKLFEHPFVAR